MRPRVVFLGNSQSLFSNRHFQVLAGSKCKIVAVVDTPPAKRTTTNPMKSAAFQPFPSIARLRKIRILEPANPNSSRFVGEMKKLFPDLFLAIGYIYLLKPPLLAVPKIVAVNFHASLLPAYRGKHPVFWALRNGERWAGLTVHVMDPHFDTGDILYQVRVPTRRKDSVGTLYDRIMDRSVGLVPRFIDDAADGKLPRRSQGRAGASYYSSTREKDFQLDFSGDAERLRRWICTSPGLCFVDICGQRVFFLDAELEPGTSRRPAGTVIRVGRANCTVTTGRGLLRLGRTKPASGKEISMAKLCRDLGIAKGSRL